MQSKHLTVKLSKFVLKEYVRQTGSEVLFSAEKFAASLGCQCVTDNFILFKDWSRSLHFLLFLTVSFQQEKKMNLYKFLKVLALLSVCFAWTFIMPCMRRMTDYIRYTKNKCTSLENCCYVDIFNYFEMLTLPLRSFCVHAYACFYEVKG